MIQGIPWYDIFDPKPRGGLDFQHIVDGHVAPKPRRFRRGILSAIDPIQDGLLSPRDNCLGPGSAKISELFCIGARR